MPSTLPYYTTELPRCAAACLLQTYCRSFRVVGTHMYFDRIENTDKKAYLQSRQGGPTLDHLNRKLYTPPSTPKIVEQASWVEACCHSARCTLRSFCRNRCKAGDPDRRISAPFRNSLSASHWFWDSSPRFFKITGMLSRPHRGHAGGGRAGPARVWWCFGQCSPISSQSNEQ